jgi:hypothetical protein
MWFLFHVYGESLKNGKKREGKGKKTKKRKKKGKRVRKRKGEKRKEKGYNFS